LHDIKNSFAYRIFRTSLLRGGILPGLLLAASPPLIGQAIPTATRPADIQVGVGFTTARPDYERQNFPGFALYADVDPREHWGVEAEFHDVHSSSGDQSAQRTVEIGGRYFRNYGSLSPFAKALYGRGEFKYPFGYTSLWYNMFAGGVGVDYKATRYIHARVEYEFQKWIGFQNGGLHPQLLTFGVAYHFDGKPRYRNH
jgi:opacity protein-like surface antigen